MGAMRLTDSAAASGPRGRGVARRERRNDTRPAARRKGPRRRRGVVFINDGRGDEQAADKWAARARRRRTLRTA